MEIKAWPYVSVGGDKKTTAGEEAEGFAMLTGTGVIPGEGSEIAVAKVADTLNVSIGTGAALITGHRAQVPGGTLTLDAGSAQPRIDVICLESNENTDVRGTRAVVVKGTPAASPNIPTLQQDGTVWQMPLARITVPAGAGTLNSAVITDMREYTQGRHNHAAADVVGLLADLDGKSDTGHAHDGRYYTEDEINTLLAGKSNTGHTHSISNVAGLQDELNNRASIGSNTNFQSLRIWANIPDATARVVNTVMFSGPLNATPLSLPDHVNWANGTIAIHTSAKKMWVKYNFDWVAMW